MVRRASYWGFSSDPRIKCPPGSPKGGGGGIHYISIGRDVLTKGVRLIFSLSGTGMCYSVNIWEGIQIYLSGKGFMSVWKWVGAWVGGWVVVVVGCLNYLSQIKTLYIPQ